ncbi:hypothetical protein A3962_04620 [Meiothermus taiwanensis]|nr:hypothetical protein A3962_04620 [Meiothermus taiwanensis]
MSVNIILVYPFGGPSAVLLTIWASKKYPERISVSTRRQFQQPYHGVIGQGRSKLTHGSV